MNLIIVFNSGSAVINKSKKKYILKEGNATFN